MLAAGAACLLVAQNQEVNQIKLSDERFLMQLDNVIQRY